MFDLSLGLGFNLVLTSQTLDLLSVSIHSGFGFDFLSVYMVLATVLLNAN